MKHIHLKLIILLFPLFGTINTVQGQVAINTDGSAPNASAMLDVTSTDKGILIPRVANTGSIASPVNGLLIYSTSDFAFMYYNGSAWMKLSTDINQWTTTGSDIYYNTGGVAIGGSSANASAALDVQSNTKGILIPRVADNSSITSPVAGLLVYNTTDQAFYHYNGTVWRMINNQWTNSGSNIYFSTGNVALGGTTPNASAILDMQSTTKGVLIPRMTLGQRGNIFPVTAGLLIYCTTDNTFYYHNGTGWVNIATGSASSQWNTSGTDIYYSTGRVAIGGTIDNTPISATFDIQSTSKGILIPRMTDVQRNAITSPVKGLLVFQTNGTEGFYYYTGSAWNLIFSLASGSSLPVSQGGTGVSTISPNQVVLGNSSGNAFTQSPDLSFTNDSLKVEGTLVNNGNVNLNGGLTEKVEILTESTTLGAGNNIVLCNPEITISLPPTTVQNMGRVYTIKNRSDTGTVTISPNGTTIDDEISIILNPNQCVKIVSGGTKWYILSNFSGTL